MNIGIIGSGPVGTCLATKLVKLGHTVSVANSRGPASLKQFAKDTGYQAVTVEKAIEGKNLIIVAIPEKNVTDLPLHLFQQLPADVVVIDTGNYFPNFRDGAIPALDKMGIDSQWVQEQLGFPVVKVFNSILAKSLKNLGRPKGEKGRIALAVSGDNAKAKEVVFGLVDGLGFDPFDIGTIAQSWKQQSGTSIYCRDIDIDELRKRVEAMTEEWSEMHPVITAKREANEVLMKADYPAYLRGLT